MTDEYEGIDEDAVEIDHDLIHVTFHQEGADDDETHALCVCWRHTGFETAADAADTLVAIAPPPENYEWPEKHCPTCRWLIEEAIARG